MRAKRVGTIPLCPRWPCAPVRAPLQTEARAGGRIGFRAAGEAKTGAGGTTELTCGPAGLADVRAGPACETGITGRARHAAGLPIVPAVLACARGAYQAAFARGGARTASLIHIAARRAVIGRIANVTAAAGSARGATELTRAATRLALGHAANGPRVAVGSVAAGLASSTALAQPACTDQIGVVAARAATAGLGWPTAGT